MLMYPSTAAYIGDETRYDTNSSKKKKKLCLGKVLLHDEWCLASVF